MIFVSLTRLRIRSIRFMPQFVVYAVRTMRQVKRAAGFQSGALLPDRSWTFWTMTAWDSQESMRAYMLAGAHKQAMPKLLHWCNEASVAHWEQAEADLPSWEEAGPADAGDGAAFKGAASESAACELGLSDSTHDDGRVRFAGVDCFAKRSAKAHLYS